jgi:hypothetical protein
MNDFGKTILFQTSLEIGKLKRYRVMLMAIITSRYFSHKGSTLIAEIGITNQIIPIAVSLALSGIAWPLV